MTSVRHHVLAKRKNFHAFHYGSVFCPPIPWVVDAAHQHVEAGKRIIVVTAREERWRVLTKNWLQAHHVPYDEIHMRATGDFRPDHVIKAELFDEFSKRYTITAAYDDNPAIVELWKSLGIPTTIVPGWDAEC